jgi:hypothetical protein
MARRDEVVVDPGVAATQFLAARGFVADILSAGVPPAK